MIKLKSDTPVHALEKLNTCICALCYIIPFIVTLYQNNCKATFL